MTFPLVPLRRIASMNSRVLSEDTDPNFAFRYVDISQVDGNGVVALPGELTSFADAPSRARRLGSAGDVAVSTVRTYLRAIASIPASMDPIVFSTGFAIIEAGPDVDPRFLVYACREDRFVSQVETRSTGISYPAINPSELASISIRLPPLEEQRRIADFLDDQVTRIDKAIAARRNQIVVLDASVVTVAQRNVTGADLGQEAAESGIPWAPLLPTTWGTPRVCQVAQMGTGHTPSRAAADYWIECDIPWLTTADVHRFRHDQIDELTETEWRLSQLGLNNSAAVLHPKGTVALSRTASAGFSVVMGADMATSQDFVTWTCGPHLDNVFLLWCLRAMRSDLLGRLAMGSTHKTIYFPDLMSIRIPLPDLPLQMQIVRETTSFAMSCRKAMAAIRESIEVLSEYKKALITQAVTGELDVTSARRGVPA